MSSVPGKLITLEGGEGAGKSTAIACVAERLRARGVDLVQVREPGGTPVGEAIRALLLDPANAGLCAEAELLMMFASRAQLLRQTIAPALARGAWVLSDRFTDASFAYQGGGRGLDTGFIAELERRVVACKPDLSLLLDLPVADGLARVRGRGASDRIEVESETFFERVRAVYRARAAADPARWRVIDASRPLAIVLDDLATTVDTFLAAHA